MKILCVGSCTYDITFPVDSFIKENTKYRLNTKIECPGGSNLNAACLLGKWDMEVYLCGIIGNDYYGSKIKKFLEKNNVNTSYLQFSNDYSTTINTVIVNKENGNRTILSAKNDKMKLDDFEINFIPDLILIDGSEYELSKKMLKKYPDAISIIDAGRIDKNVIELSHLVDFTICSLDFAEHVTNIKLNFNNTKSVISIYESLKNMFKNNIIVTLGEFGALYYYENKIKIMKSITVDSIDTTGAGDIFHGAFVYGTCQKMSLENIIKLSNVTAALSTTKYGSSISIPTKKEVKEKLNEYK